MKGFPLLLILAGSMAAVGEAAAQQATQVCRSLQTKIEQSPASLEGRVLNEILFEAAALDCPDIVHRMLDLGASVAARNRRGATPLNVAAAHGSLQTAELFLSLGAEIEHRDLAGETPLLGAAGAGRRRMAAALVEAGADVNGTDKQNVTPLMAAAFEGDRRMVRLFLEAGAETSASDIHGKGALIYAAGRAYPDIVEMLLTAGADADGVWGNDLTPLMWAAGHANDAPVPDGIKVAAILLEAGARIDRRDNRGRDALMIAASRGHREMVEFLMAHGADPSVRDKEGLAAIDLASDDAVRAALAD